MPTASVRNQVHLAWPRLTPWLRYINTINRSLPQNPPLPLPDIWGTLAFQSTSRRMLTMGSNPWVEEQGTVAILLIGRSGHGDGPLAAAASTVMEAWHGWAAPGGDIWFRSVGAPRQVELESIGEWFILEVACEYTAQARVPLPDLTAGYTLTAHPGAFITAAPTP